MKIDFYIIDLVNHGSYKHLIHVESILICRNDFSPKTQTPSQHRQSTFNKFHRAFNAVNANPKIDIIFGIFKDRTVKYILNGYHIPLVFLKGHIRPEKCCILLYK